METHFGLFLSKDECAQMDDFTGISGQKNIVVARRTSLS